MGQESIYILKRDGGNSSMTAKRSAVLLIKPSVLQVSSTKKVMRYVSNLSSTTSLHSVTRRSPSKKSKTASKPS